MTKFKNEFRIESVRLKDWDYSMPWWYYITINTKNHICWFGDIINNKIILNQLGKIVEQCWVEIPNHYPSVELDEYVIMPNHIHGIVIISKSGKRRDVACNVSTNKFSKISPKPGSLSVIIRSFKSAIAKQIHEISYGKFAWQPRFYDRIIRNEKELYNIKKYIEQNPLKWEIEKHIPENIEF
jgi:REP element-mobilizing transposase RayT